MKQTERSISSIKEIYFIGGNKKNLIYFKLNIFYNKKDTKQHQQQQQQQKTKTKTKKPQNQECVCDRCVSPSRWSRLAGPLPLQWCMPGREIQFGPKKVQKKVLQAILVKKHQLCKARTLHCPLKAPEQAHDIWTFFHWRR